MSKAFIVLVQRRCPRPLSSLSRGDVQGLYRPCPKHRLLGPPVRACCNLLNLIKMGAKPHFLSYQNCNPPQNLVNFISASNCLHTEAYVYRVLSSFNNIRRRFANPGITLIACQILVFTRPCCMYKSPLSCCTDINLLADASPLK